MANVVAKVLEGLKFFVWTIWGLQERRFSITFDAVSSAVVSMTTAFAFCFLTIHRYSQAGTGFAVI